MYEWLKMKWKHHVTSNSFRLLKKDDLLFVLINKFVPVYKIAEIIFTLRINKKLKSTVLSNISYRDKNALVFN